jgi:hypothetical protein
MTTFEIGSQNAGSIQNVGGDLTIGELHVEAAWSAVEVQQELARLQEELNGVPISYPTRVAAESALAAAQAEAAAQAPDRARISELLQRATQVLSNAGSLTTTGTGLAEALRRAAVVLGPAGKAVLALLPLV